jgi:hypothetical protein
VSAKPKLEPVIDDHAGDVQLPAVVRRPPTLALKPDDGPELWHHNFDLSLEAGVAALINAANVPDWIPQDGGSVTLDAVHYIVCPDTYVDRQSGQVVDCTAVIFVARDGTRAKFRNEWSLRRLNAVLALYPPERWKRGVQIECYAKHSKRSGHVYGSFRIVPQEHTGA